MRKNYFAKKFVAYSMAFAVAFSTLTVSPVFVKEAKAAPSSVLTVATLTDTVVEAGDVVLGPMTSSEAKEGGLSIALADFTTATGFDANKILNASMTTTKKTAANLSYVNDYNFVASTLGDGSANLDSSDHDVPVVLNGKTRIDVGTDTETQSTVGNKNVQLKLTDEASASRWFKVVPKTKTFLRNCTETANKQETVSLTYYELVSAGDETTGIKTFSEVTKDNFGLYLGVTLTDETVGDDTIKSTTNSAAYTLFHVYEKSDLVPVANQSEIKANVGQAVKLEVTATSTRKELKYSWTKDGNELKDQTSAVIDIASVEEKDFGTYMCTVNDGLTNAEPVQIKLSKATKASDTERTSATTVKSFAKIVNSTEDGKLAGGVATLTSSIPSNADYRYVWQSTSGVPLTKSENDTMNHDASNNSITITSATAATTGFDVNDKIECYVVSKDVYETIFATELEDINKASVNTKYEAIKLLRTAEQAFNFADPANKEKFLYKEEFTLKMTNDTSLSETLLLGLGESLSLTAPVEGTAYVWSGKGTGSEKVIKKNTIGINDFGTYTVAVTTSAGSINKNFNVIYKSDLTASASDIVAKPNSKVTLKVNASATLPVDYTWNFMVPNTDEKEVKTHTDLKGGVVKTDDNSQLEIASVANHVFDASGAVTTMGNYVIPEKRDTDGNLTNAEAYYYQCKVSDGIISKYVKVRISADLGFQVKNAADAYVNGTPTGTAVPMTVGVIKDRTYTLTPDVKTYNDTVVKYSWTVNGKEVANTPSYTFTKDDKVSIIYCTIKDDTNIVNITYTLTPLNANTLSNDVDDYVVETKDLVYTGKELKGVTKVVDKANHLELVEGVDYEVAYVENINVGIARATVKLIGLYKDVVLVDSYNKPASLDVTFFIDRADNELTVADKVVAVGGSVQPKTINKAGAAVTYTYYTDEACTTAIEGVPTKVGVYYVKATSIATTNYNEATSNVAKVVIAPGKPKIGNTSRTASSITLNWAKTSGATAYRVYIKKNGKFTKVANTTGLKYTVKGLASATTYEFAVKAFVKGVASPVYSVRKTTTAPAKVATPAVKAGSRKATVSFKKVTRATGYQVYMAKGNGKYVKVATTAKLSVTKTRLTKGATYKFKVRAYKKVGSNVYYGAFSSAKAVKVK